MQVWGILVLIGLTTTVLGAVGVLLYLPQGRGGLVLRAPVMPWLAVLAMVGTCAMMAGLADKTWILYGGWMAIGTQFVSFSQEDIPDKKNSEGIHKCCY